MAEALFQKLEEKMMMVLAEIEELRKENQHLRHENSLLTVAKENHETDRLNQEKKLEAMISLLDAVCDADKMSASLTNANVTNIISSVA